MIVLADSQLQIQLGVCSGTIGNTCHVAGTAASAAAEEKTDTTSESVAELQQR